VLRRRSCGRLWNRQIRPQISSILIPVDGRPYVLCVPLAVRQRDALLLAAPHFSVTHPPLPCVLSGEGLSPAESCVRRAALCFLLLPTIISFPSYQRSVSDAAQRFPANVNVAVALSLAGIGPDRTKYELWADPGVERNMHTFAVKSAESNRV